MSTTASVKGSAVLLEDGLQAGLLIIEEEGPRTPEAKEYGAFAVDEGSGAITHSRVCSRSEKKKLAKMLYGSKEIHRVRTTTVDGAPCALFVTR